MQAWNFKCSLEQWSSREAGERSRNTWLSLPPGQQDFYSKYTLSVSRTSLMHVRFLHTADWANSNRVIVSAYNFLMLKIAGQRMAASETMLVWQQRSRVKKKNLYIIWLNVYLCLGPSLSLSVYVLIAGLSGVLCCGWKGSVMWWQRRVCLCMYGHRDSCMPIFVVSHVWNARYVWVSVWTRGDAHSVYVVIVFAAVGWTGPLVSAWAMLSLRDI